MTRANLNYVYQERGSNPKTLYFYQNGDQYPRGIRDFFHVDQFINSDWTPKAFKKWIGDNYKVQGRKVTKCKNGITIDAHCELEEPARTSKISHPCIYYDDAGFITDYSYVFDSTLEKSVKVYQWDEQIFNGTAKDFLVWLKKQK